jgi:tRNA uridine 5-carboxymethylaminomethyl modification enzyme
VRYRGYIEREQRLAAQRARFEEALLPDSLWARELAGLSREAVEKLRIVRPSTVGQATRVTGVSPADVAVLLVLARRERAALASR